MSGIKWKKGGFQLRGWCVLCVCVLCVLWRGSWEGARGNKAERYCCLPICQKKLNLEPKKPDLRLPVLVGTIFSFIDFCSSKNCRKKIDSTFFRLCSLNTQQTPCNLSSNHSRGLKTTSRDLTSRDTSLIRESNFRPQFFLRCLPPRTRKIQ